MSYKVSVIVPVYNTGKYLKRCLDSILNQTYKDIEIVLINDGSNDELTLTILNEYKNHQKIVYFENENMGISKTRNFALDHMSGDYLTFVDSDDYIDHDMIEKMMIRMLKDHTDLVQASFIVEYEHFKLRRAKPKNLILNREELYTNLVKNMGVNNYLWAKLYKKELFKDVRFDVNYAGFEDVMIMPLIFKGVKKASLMTNRFYHYIQRKGSYTNGMGLDIAMDMFNSFKDQEKLINDILKDRKLSNHENYYRSEMMILSILLFNKINVDNFTYPKYDDTNIWKIFKYPRNLLKTLVKIKYKDKMTS